jgi:hypothetical protein
MSLMSYDIVNNIYVTRPLDRMDEIDISGISSKEDMDVSMLTISWAYDSSYCLYMRARGGRRGYDDCYVRGWIIEPLLQHLAADDYIHLMLQKRPQTLLRGQM